MLHDHRSIRTTTLNDACGRIKRDAQTGEIVNVTINYGNAGRIETSGFDVQADWGVTFKDVGINIPGRYSVNMQFNYLNRFAITTDEVAVPLIDYAGTTGGADASLGTQGNSYRWKLFTRFNYAVGPLTLGRAVAAQAADRAPDQGDQLERHHHDLRRTVLQSVQPVRVRSGSIAARQSGSASTMCWTSAPPWFAVSTANQVSAGQLPGGRFAAGDYDSLGRRFYLGASIKL